jgi:signal transduction histidine kinase
VVEDALDMTRMENNMFEANMDFFDLKSTLEEIISVMQFQTNKKGLYLKLI